MCILRLFEMMAGLPPQQVLYQLKELFKWFLFCKYFSVAKLQRPVEEFPSSDRRGANPGLVGLGLATPRAGIYIVELFSSKAI